MSQRLAEFDVLVAGAGPAGCAAAAALAELELRALVVDAGVDASKQLAGELIHPPGVEDLSALGFAHLTDAGAQAVDGFAVMDERAGRVSLLPYPAGKGVALEHAQLRRALSEGLAGRSGVTLWPRTRLIAILGNGPGGIQATLRREGGEPEEVRARLLVAADGRGSQARKLLGIEETRERLSSMIGVLIDAALLPHPGFGHLFVGATAPVLAYAIAPSVARIMIDLPAGTAPLELASSPELLSALPKALRGAVLEAVRRGPVLTAANETRLSHAVALQSAVLVGDAAGCCHPVSASGLSSCTRDARVLQAAIRLFPGDFPAAVRWYAAQTRAPQRTRLALASALYRAFSQQSAEMAALRAGLFDYWGRSRTGPTVSMALLSTRESRMWIMAREYARAVGHALRLMRLSRASVAAAVRLAASIAPHLRVVAVGSVEDVRAAFERLRLRLSRPARRPQLRAAEPEPSRAPLSRL